MIDIYKYQKKYYEKNKKKINERNMKYQQKGKEIYL